MTSLKFLHPTKEEKFLLSFEEQYFIKDIVGMAKRSGKKFALSYLDDCDKRPCLSVDNIAYERANILEI